jgi:hypothetical protein
MLALAKQFCAASVPVTLSIASSSSWASNKSLPPPELVGAAPSKDSPPLNVIFITGPIPIDEQVEVFMRMAVSKHAALESAVAKLESACHPPLTVPFGQSEQLLAPAAQEGGIEVLKSDAKFPKSHPDVMREVEEVNVYLLP